MTTVASVERPEANGAITLSCYEASSNSDPAGSIQARN